MNAEPIISNDLLTGGESSPVAVSEVPANVSSLPATEPPAETAPSGAESPGAFPGAVPGAALGQSTEPIQDNPACNCGKIPGTKGPHKLTCPMRGRGRGFSPSPSLASDSTIAGPSTIGTIEPEKPPVDYKAMACAVFDMSTGLAAGSIGPEWKPSSPEEREMMVNPLAAYFQSREQKDIPPGLLLAMCFTAYCAPRVTHENTKTKLVNAYLWIKPKFKSVWSSITGLFRKRKGALSA